MTRGRGILAGRRTRLAWLGVGAVLLALLVIALVIGGTGHHRARPIAPPSASGPPALPGPATPLLGANVNRLLLDNTYSAAQIDAQLSALARTGAADARTDALWEAAEPAPPVNGVHHYDWAFSDRIAAALAGHGLRWLPIIDYTAGWAQTIPGQDHSPPRGASSYAAYAAAFAARYGPGGSFWAEHPTIPPRPVTTYEIWNEPDGGHFWLPGPDPRAYANLYAAARTAIKAVDPAGRVLIGGLTNPPLFLPAVLAARPDLRGQIDGVAIHPYGPSPMAMLGAMKTDRTLLRSLGLPGVPLYVTEFGWVSHPQGARDWIPPRLRPGYIRTSFQALAHSDCGIGGIILYTWVTPERDPANEYDWFGIHPPRGGGTPATTAAFADGIASANRSQAPERVCG
jgi:hypothetical protein